MINNEYVWTAAGTDIEKRWKDKYGWIKPSELPEYQAKFKYYQELPLRQLDDKARLAYENVLRRAKVIRIS